MKKTNYILSLKSLLMSALVILCVTSCEDDKVDLGENYGFAYSQEAIAQKINMELEEEKTIDKSFNFVLRREAVEEVQVSYKYDETLIDVINKKANKNYKVFPKELYTLTKEEVSILPGKTLSDSVKLNIKYGKGLEENVEYIIPLKATVLKGNISIPEKDSYLAFIVKVPLNSTKKSTGIKIFNCVEINRINPLNSLNFKLKNSDKYLFDAVILFSANMQYNDKTKKLHLSLNPKNKYLFDNADKYIKPLQDAGMKVVFGILPHHTAAGLANMTDAGCKQFAQEIKKFNDTYGLDGVFLDDEYGYKGTGDPSVLLPQVDINASSRLAYEIKKIMPDKWVTIYAYSNLIAMAAVDNKYPGEFIDYILPDYGVRGDFSNYYYGLPKMRTGQFSMNFSNLAPLKLPFPYLKELRDNGYGANMTYDVDPTKTSFKERENNMWFGELPSQLEVLEFLTESLFDDELIFNEKVYQSEWSHLDGDPKEWTGE